MIEQQIDGDKLGLLQARQRLWFVCIRKDVVDVANLGEKDVLDIMQRPFECLFTDVVYELAFIALCFNENNVNLLANRRFFLAILLGPRSLVLLAPPALL